MTSSSERVLRGESAVAVATLATPDLRSGSWTRLGDERVLGDAVTEHSLAGLAETTRAAAQAQGYAVGWAEGRRAAAELAAEADRAAAEAHAAAEERREAEHAAALAALTRAAAALQQTSARLAGELEDQAVRLARELTTELVGHEVRTCTDAGVDVVRRALVVLPTGVPVTLRVHPSVVSSPAVGDLADHGVSVVADPTLDRADAVVESTEAVVDLRIGAALERVREALA